MAHSFSKNWFYYFKENPDQRFGPVDSDRIPFSDNVFVWRSGMRFWTNKNSVAELQDAVRLVGVCLSTLNSQNEQNNHHFSPYFQHLVDDLRQSLSETDREHSTTTNLEKTMHSKKLIRCGKRSNNKVSHTDCSRKFLENVLYFDKHEKSFVFRFSDNNAISEKKSYFKDCTIKTKSHDIKELTFENIFQTPLTTFKTKNKNLFPPTALSHCTKHVSFVTELDSKSPNQLEKSEERRFSINDIFEFSLNLSALVSDIVDSNNTESDLDELEGELESEKFPTKRKFLSNEEIDIVFREICHFKEKKIFSSNSSAKKRIKKPHNKDIKIRFMQQQERLNKSTPANHQIHKRLMSQNRVPNSEKDLFPTLDDNPFSVYLSTSQSSIQSDETQVQNKTDRVNGKRVTELDSNTKSNCETLIKKILETKDFTIIDSSDCCCALHKSSVDIPLGEENFLKIDKYSDSSTEPRETTKKNCESINSHPGGVTKCKKLDEFLTSLEKEKVEHICRTIENQFCEPESEQERSKMENSGLEKGEFRKNAPGVKTKTNETREAGPKSLRASLKLGLLTKNAKDKSNDDEWSFDEQSSFKIGEGLNEPIDLDACRLNVLHSSFAIKTPQPFYPVRWTPGALRMFHKPKLRLQNCDYVPMRLIKPFKHEKTDPKTIKDLSAASDKVMLFEYVEQFPPFLHNVGMASRLYNYYRPSENEKIKEFKNESKFAKLHILAKKEPSPFFGEIREGENAFALENNLYRAPVCDHNIPETDFLGVRLSDSEWVIRPISKIFAVGQEQPKRLVFSPRSQSANELIKNRISALILERFYKIWKKSKHRGPICALYDDLTRLFDLQYESLFKEKIRDWATYERGTKNLWTFKDNAEILKRVYSESSVSPDDICVIESMRAAEQRLHDLGITDLIRLNKETLSMIMNRPNDSLKELCLFISKEIENTPWNKTFIFNQARLFRCMLKTRNTDNKLIKSEFGFLFERVGNKLKQKTHQNKRKSDEEDLRKISTSEAKKVLKGMGVDAKDLEGMTRWDLVSLIKEFSQETKDFAKYSRVASSKQQEYKSDINRIFADHLRFLRHSSSAQQMAMDLEKLFEEDLGAEVELASTNAMENEIDAELVAKSLIIQAGKPVEPKESKGRLGSAVSEDAVSQVETSQGVNKKEKIEESEEMARKKRKKYRRVAKKRVVLTICKPVPKGDPVIEIITDTEKIISYLNTRREERQNELNSLPQDERTRKKEEFEEIRREQMKKLELNRQNDYLKEQRAIQRSITNAHIRCSECGMRGHIKTNRSICLKYLSNANRTQNDTENITLVDTSTGDAIKIDTAKVNKAVYQSKKKGKKRHIDLSKGIDEENDIKKESDPCMKFRNILIEIMGNIKKWFPEEVAVFTKPVSKANTEYYATITSPMCLSEIIRRIENSSLPYASHVSRSTKKRKVKHGIRYKTRDEFVRDFELIYENAKEFYGEESKSTITTKARVLVENVKKIVLTKKDQLDNLSSEIKESETEQKLLDNLKVVLDAMFSSQHSFYFKSDPTHLPQYKTMIKTPMFLDLIKEKIEDCKYAQVDEFVADCHLIVQNARAYNEKYPDVIKSAENLMADGQTALNEEYKNLSKLDRNARQAKIIPIPKFKKEEVLNTSFMDFSHYQTKQDSSSQIKPSRKKLKTANSLPPAGGVSKALNASLAFNNPNRNPNFAFTARTPVTRLPSFLPNSNSRQGIVQATCYAPFSSRVSFENFSNFKPGPRTEATPGMRFGPTMGARPAFVHPASLFKFQFPNRGLQGRSHSSGISRNKALPYAQFGGSRFSSPYFAAARANTATARKTNVVYASQTEAEKNKELLSQVGGMKQENALGYKPKTESEVSAELKNVQKKRPRPPGPSVFLD